METVPHDSSAFTQGLVIVASKEDPSNFTLFEGTGLYGQSDMRIVDLKSGEAMSRTPLASAYFGEGVAYYTTPSGEGRLVQLTWRERTAFVYDSNLERLSEFSYRTSNNEGWGITRRDEPGGDSFSFLVTDGSSNLMTWEAETWREMKRITVGYRVEMNNEVGFVSQNRLNELEWDPHSDTVLANIWFRDRIVRIDPVTGYIKVDYDMRELYPNRPSSADVLNGIACVPGSPDEYWITGKLWPVMFRVRLFVEDET